MRVATKKIYQIELILQVICLIPLIIGHIGALVEPWTLILGLSAQFLIGCIQVLSGLGHYAVYKDKGRGTYLLCAMGYLIVLYFGTFLVASITEFAHSNWEIVGMMLAILFHIIIPSGIALWYAKTTFDRMNVAPVKSPKLKIKNGDKDLLDDELIYSPQ
jgi:hypothetical protein